ncbi:nitrilase-related carbon-nitrogen hydrolase [Actinoplanes sp. NPDC051513]|uniref:nitrilase-related carbon-nitrogen hydrolase n=1 Tax=Actinoplanes sp. NPDC051513 TaxID=3363908 RepID=UPI0037BC384F
MLTIVAAALSGLLWLTGQGLHPIAALTWVAPLPLLLTSLRVRPKSALLATIVAWTIGQLGALPYYHGTLRIPLTAVTGVLLLGAALAAGTVLLARALLLRGRTVTAILAAPALWVLGEYAASLLLPHGAWWSLAYTQAGLRPVVQLTAVTGVWGVTYLLLAVPIAVAALITRPRPALACLLALIVTTGGAAAWSLARSPATPELTVGLVALEQADDGLPLDQSSGRELLARYVPRVESLVGRGAGIVVLPEKAFGVTDTTLPRLVDAFRPATSQGARLVVGAVLKHDDTDRNVALVLGPGGAVTTYAKQHLIPGLEDWLTPGAADLVVDGRFGVAICKDLDFPALVRGYRRDGATMILVPALDFTADGWLHSRMALVRGVENGITVVRAASYGRLTVTDPTGRVLGEAVAGDAELLVAAPVTARSTIYSRTGDWFPLLAVFLLVAAVVVARNSAESRRVSASAARRSSGPSAGTVPAPRPARRGRRPGRTGTRG